jgi:hypothetical protein
VSALTTLHSLSPRPDEVPDALRRGRMLALETTAQAMPDVFLLYAIESGLLEPLANPFPDPRQQPPEIPMRRLLAVGLAGRFAGLYALSQSP